MLSSIHIQGFKGFKDTKIEPLRRVNLIVGGQNSGKTSLLEALALTFAGKNIQSSLSSLFRADIQQQLFWQSLITQGLQTSYMLGDTEQGPFEWMLGDTVANSKFGKPYQSAKVGGLPLAIYRPQQHDTKEDIFQHFPSWTPKSSEILNAFKPIAEERAAEKKLIEQLSKIDDRIVDIRFSPPSEILVGMSDLPKRVNMQLLGQGINRISVLIFKLLTQKPSFALIDELENGIHYGSLATVWQSLANIARELDIQLFITTHSWECILAAGKIYEDAPDEFQIIRLERSQDNNIKPIILSGENLNFALENHWEIR